MYENNYDFVMLAETHVTSDVEDSEIGLNGYRIFRCDSDSARTGCVVLYAKKEYKSEVIRNLSFGMSYWWMAVKVCRESNCWVIGVLYRSPSSRVAEFTGYFEEWSEDVVESGMKVIVVGDFNIDYKMENTNKLRIKQIIEDNNCKQLVSVYTRVTERSKTLIDYVITNDQSVSARTDKVLKVSDHETIEIGVECEVNSMIKRRKRVCYLNYDSDYFLNALRGKGLNELSESDVSEKAKFLENALINTVNEMKVEKFVNERQFEWFSNDLRNLRQRKIDQYNRAALSDLESEWENYKNLRNMYKKSVRRTKSNFIKKQIGKATDQKSMWRTIKNLVLRENKVEINEVMFEGVIVEDNHEKAEKFNKYFVKSVQEINESIVNERYDESNVEVHNNRFIFKYIDMYGLIGAVKMLKQKRDFNLLNPKMLLDAMPEIGDVLLNIINGSMESGVFPETWKESVVVPVEKLKNSKQCMDFRSVNMLPVYEKVIEKVIQMQLEKYLEENGLLIPQQSGFRKGHSCESALNCTIMDWKSEIDQKKCVIAVFKTLH